MAACKILAVSMKVEHDFIVKVPTLKVKAGNGWFILPIFLVIPNSGSKTLLKSKTILDFIENAYSL